MAVILEFYSLIIRRDRLEALLPGGWRQYLAEQGEPDFGWADGELLRDGAMNIHDLDALVSYWKRRGLVLQATKNGQKYWKDMVVDASMSDLSMSGLTIRDCDWLDVSIEGQAGFIGSTKAQRARKIQSPWPAKLIHKTTEQCEYLLLTPPAQRKGIQMKNSDGSIALLTTDSFMKKGLILTDQSNGARRMFQQPAIPREFEQRHTRRRLLPPMFKPL